MELVCQRDKVLVGDVVDNVVFRLIDICNLFFFYQFYILERSKRRVLLVFFVVGDGYVIQFYLKRCLEEFFGEFQIKIKKLMKRVFYCCV